MRGTYKAKIIRIDGNTVTYEYSDKAGFTQITSALPSGITVKKGDTVWITVEDGQVISVGKRGGGFPRLLGIRAIGWLVLIIVLLILWLVFFVLKKLLTGLIGIIVLICGAVFIFSAIKRR